MAPSSSMTENVALKVPTSDGVPEICPEGSRAMPVGKDPDKDVVRSPKPPCKVRSGDVYGTLLARNTVVAPSTILGNTSTSKVTFTELLER